MLIHAVCFMSIGAGYDYYGYGGHSAAVIGDTVVLPRHLYGVKLLDLTP